ncbi:TonB-dependent receptor domain-containing protein [Granulicella sp. L60]|jgi:Carboxypeptidase regulatory-like domain/TonB dependent receptor/TonB-dependent Receptor Plug Domain|uniref:TonB-dependent receptor n=1 Tax=Granulicella sp. L60 TaxID=1641866 RepID=UPI00131AEFFB|nr:TonB-dependent receptor [Granulicella sp. L60]
MICPLNRSFLACKATGTFALLSILLLLTVSGIGQVASSINGRVVDAQGGGIPRASVTITSSDVGTTRETVADGKGEFLVQGLTPGFYTIKVSSPGFATQEIKKAELLVNQPLTPTITMTVATATTEMTVTSAAPMLETTTSSTGATITPRQIEDMPINGRNYLDLMQLVPGVAINRQANTGSDAATPILGERGGNADFLIDGMPNNDYLNGGAAAQFNQDAILEFQVITSSYKAEFGHSSGGVINVVSRSGTNDVHGLISFFHRNSVFDSSDNSLSKPPFLLRWDPAAQIGGPLLRGKIFAFASAERIMESRQLNFVYPAGLPPSLQVAEATYDKHSMTDDTRFRVRLDEQFGRHQISEQVNYTNNHISDYLPLSLTTSLPSTRSNIGQRYLMIGGSDAWLFGSQSNPFLITSYAQFRGEPSLTSASHPQAGISNTLDNLFSGLDTGDLFGDQGQVSYGAGFTPLQISQDYISFGSNLTKHIGNHDPKIGWDYQHTHVDGTESNSLFNQLFSTESDLAQYGSTNSGVYYLTEQGGTTAQNQIRLRNAYDGLFAQDDWKIKGNITLNLGLRWDYDSRFPNTGNVSPRIGIAWQVLPKTVVHASYGIFYDHFRLGIARDVPQFGGATVISEKYMSFPRLFYGNPSTITSYFNGLGDNVPCVANSMTDAQIAAAKLTCAPGVPLYGIDHLNNATGVAQNAVVNESNVQTASGLSPDAFLAVADAAINQQPGYFTWDPFGNLSIHDAFAQYTVPVTVDPAFKTPYTTAIHFGIQQELTPTMTLTADYYHRNINHILGVRVTNLTFESREVGNSTTYTNGTERVLGYGPWLGGFFDGLTLELAKRMSRHFQGSIAYTYAKEWDNALNSSLNSSAQTTGGATYIGVPTDSYVGPVPNYTDPVTGANNAQHAFIASNGNYIPKVQAHYNGPDLDYGPSDLSIPQTVLAHGIWDMPLGFQLSGIFRAQSGFAYTLASNNPPDVDGDGLYGGRDLNFIRNSNRAPVYINMDTRVSKIFQIKDAKRLNLYFEMFNLFNNANTAGITQYETLPDNSQPPTTTQTLPGREGEVGLRFDF